MKRVPSGYSFNIFGTKVIHMHINSKVEAVHKLLVELCTSFLVNVGHGTVCHILPIMIATT